MRQSKAELRDIKTEIHDLREDVSHLTAEILSTRALRSAHAELVIKNHGLKPTISELPDELKQYADQYDWQFTGSAGSNAEARQPEPKACGGTLPPERSADDDKGGGDYEALSPLRHTVLNEVIDVRALEVDRIDVASWPKLGSLRVWRMNLVDKVVATSAGPKSAFKWITELGKPGLGYADMAETSSCGVSFATVEAKLGSALTGIAPSEFLRQVQLNKSEASHTGEMVTGRPPCR